MLITRRFKLLQSGQIVLLLLLLQHGLLIGTHSASRILHTTTEVA